MQHKTKLAKLVDILTIFLITTIVLDLIISKFIKNVVISFCISIFLSVLILMGTIREIKKRDTSKALSRKEDIEMQECLTALKFGDPIKIRKLLVGALKKKYVVKEYKNFLELTNGDTRKTVYYNFLKEILTIEDISHYLSKRPSHDCDIFILANTFTPDAESLASTIKTLKLLDGKETYLLLKGLKTLPKIKQPPALKQTLKSKLLSSLSKKNSFKFLRFGLLLYVLSLIMPFSTYYKFFAFLLVILGIISLFKQTKKVTLSNQNLL